MGLKINHISASHHVSHEGAGLIAVTGALAFAKHDGGHQMPDAETYFFVAGERGDGLTKSTFSGDVNIGGDLSVPRIELSEGLYSPLIEHDTKIEMISPEIELNSALVVLGEEGVGSAEYQDIVFTNASNPSVEVEVYYQNQGPGFSASATEIGGDVYIYMASGETTAAQIIAAIQADANSNALISPALKAGSLGTAAQTVA